MALREEPRTQKEALAYYKGLHDVGQLVKQRDGLESQLAEVNKSIAEIVKEIKKYKTWEEVAEIICLPDDWSEYRVKKHIATMLFSAGIEEGE